jgi:hypothetical protein
LGAVGIALISSTTVFVAREWRERSPRVRVNGSWARESIERTEDMEDREEDENDESNQENLNVLHLLYTIAQVSSSLSAFVGD